MWWPKLREALDAVPEDEAPEERRSDRDILEELLELTRLQVRFTLPTALWTEEPAREIHEQAQALVDEALGQIGQSESCRVANTGPPTSGSKCPTGTVEASQSTSPDYRGRKGLLALMRNKATSKEASDKHVRTTGHPDGPIVAENAHRHHGSYRTGCGR
jgi:hypothetical protein